VKWSYISENLGRRNWTRDSEFGSGVHAFGHLRGPTTNDLLGKGEMLRVEPFSQNMQL